MQTSIQGFTIRGAERDDVPLILQFIESLARFERLSHECVATHESLHRTLFGEHPYAEVLIGEVDDEPVAFALFFHNYSTFLARPGIYLEDLFVKPSWRGRGFGRKLLHHIAGLAVERECGRLEWAVLNWNEDAVRFYERLGAVPMEEWTTFRLTGEPLQRVARQ